MQPLVLKSGFSYMTDVPFLMLIVIGMSCYSRGIALENYGWMIAGSVAAVASILVRKFGVAFICALESVWLIDRGCRCRPLQFAAGALLLKPRPTASATPF